ncbi:hypothetical protein BDV98DRAFT_359140 [Pterulicium gracile]|uniref:Uncharacterized protein n=1 Tax=Pterulicium gracile TaxID=1884261 RepID=A0A5C3QQ00_9AGAR|nr:hypothetical protein BDV98DRAFT_359140 [Pterula gracilis]
MFLLNLRPFLPQALHLNQRPTSSLLLILQITRLRPVPLVIHPSFLQLSHSLVSHLVNSVNPAPSVACVTLGSTQGLSLVRSSQGTNPALCTIYSVTRTSSPTLDRAIDVLEHGGDSIIHLMFTLILLCLFPNRTSDFYLAVRLSLESSEMFILYLMQWVERTEDYTDHKHIADKFKAVIGALHEEQGFNGAF